MCSLKKLAALFVTTAFLLSSTACNNSPAYTKLADKLSVGDDVIFSHVSMGEYSARMVLFDIEQLPSDEKNFYVASVIGVYLYGPRGRSGSPLWLDGGLPHAETASAVWASCTENALQIYEIEWNGEKKYILRLYKHYGTENGTYESDDPNLYCASFYLLNDMDTGEDLLYPINKKSSTGTELHISDSVVYKGENVLYDENQQLELVFDPDNHNVDIVQTGEE